MKNNSDGLQTDIASGGLLANNEGGGLYKKNDVGGFRPTTTVVGDSGGLQKKNRECPWLPNFRRRTIIMAITLKTSGEVQVENAFRRQARVVGFN